MSKNYGPETNINDMFHTDKLAPLKEELAVHIIDEEIHNGPTMVRALAKYQQAQTQFTDLLTQAMGYFPTEEFQNDGSVIHYEHDRPLLADSMVIYKKTATTMSWSDDGGAHWYGMTAEGNILARVLTVIGINAEWVNISGASNFAYGYDPSTKETPVGAQEKADAAFALAQEFVNGVADNLQSQIDGNITTFFYAYVPLTTNAPATEWITTEIRNQHLGDLFYDTATGFSYRYQLVEAIYSWQRITDTDITTALANAAAAQDTADNKRRVFVVTPTTPYDIGDLWAGGSGSDLKRCLTSRTSGAYIDGDWALATKYTDDTTANSAATVAAAKNKTFNIQPTPPYYSGDIWQKQQVPTAITDILRCTVTRLTGVYTAADWVNAFTLPQIQAMGSTIISGGRISTQMLTSPDGLTYLDLVAGNMRTESRMLLFDYPAGTPHYEKTVTRMQGGLLSVNTTTDATNAPVKIGQEVGLFEYAHSGDNDASSTGALRLQAALLAQIGGKFAVKSLHLSNTGVIAGDDGSVTNFGTNTIPVDIWPPVEFYGTARKAATPTDPTDLVNKTYADDLINTLKNGGIVTGLNADRVDGYHLADLLYQMSFNLKASSFLNSVRDFINGTWIYTDIPFEDGAAVYLEVKGNSYGSGIPFEFKAQGYMYAGVFFSPSASATGRAPTVISVFSNGGMLTFYFPRMGYWHGFSAFCGIVSNGGSLTNRVSGFANGGYPAGALKLLNIQVSHNVTYQDGAFNVYVNAAGQNVAQNVTINIPTGYFDTTPRMAMLEVQETNGWVCSYKRNSSSASSLVFGILKCDGSLAAGTYTVSLLAGN